MAYRPFYEFVLEDTPATIATTATKPRNVANVAIVATVPPEKPPPTVANVAIVAGPFPKTDFAADLNEAEQQYVFDERAGILEYDCGLSRQEAERLALIQISGTVH